MIFSQLRLHLNWAALLFLTSGCGVADYQSRMDDQRKRIEKIDEFNSLLDDPIDPPTLTMFGTKEEKPAWPFEVYLRLPKGFGTAPKDKTPYYTNFPFFRYGSDDPAFNIFLVAALVAEPDAKQDVGKFHPKMFRFYIKKAIEDYYLKTTKFHLLLPDKIEENANAVKSFAFYPEDGKSFLYRTYEYRDTAHRAIKDHSVFRIHLHEEAGKQFCLVEQRPLLVPNEAFDKAFKASLRTLDISADAGSKRTQFRKARGY